MTKKPVTTGDLQPDPHHSAPLLREVRGLIELARDHVAHEANSTLTMLYWKIGQRIRGEVLKNDRATYGQQIVATLADPALSLERARETWQKHGRSEKWIQQRMTGHNQRLGCRLWTA